MKLIAFDLDGTLYNSKDSHLLAMQNLFQTYTAVRLPDQKEIFAMVGESPSVFLEWVQTFGINADQKTILQTLNRLEIEAVYAVGTLYENTAETLNTLKEKGFILALCTNAPVNYWQAVLDKFNLTSFFDYIRSPLQKSDTKTLMLKDIIANAQAQTCWMVGDRKHDMQAALDNQSIAVGIQHGFGTDEILQTAHHLITNLAQLIPLVKA